MPVRHGLVLFVSSSPVSIKFSMSVNTGFYFAYVSTSSNYSMPVVFYSFCTWIPCTMIAKFTYSFNYRSLGESIATCTCELRVIYWVVQFLQYRPNHQYYSHHFVYLTACHSCMCSLLMI